MTAQRPALARSDRPPGYDRAFGRAGRRLGPAVASMVAIIGGAIAVWSPSAPVDARRLSDHGGAPVDAGRGHPGDGPLNATPTPDAAPLLRGVLQRPVSLDVAPDGRVYLSDPGPGLVQVMQPWGEFLTPIGLTGVEDARLETPGHLTVGRDPASGEHRLYVQDTGAKTVVVYDLDGGFIAAWPKIKGAGIAAAPDGRVFVADRTDYTVRVFQPDGTELFRFGEKGAEAGQFDSFTGMGISPAGDVLAVGDQKGKRVQLFNLPADPLSDDVRLRRPPYNLELGRYTSGDLTCRATVVNALGGDDVWIGEGNGACVVTPRSAEFPIASSTFDSHVCKPTLRLPRIRRASGQFYALATYDPNLGPCGGKQTALPAAPVILRYLDIDLKRVHTLWPVPGSAVVVRAADDTTVRNTDPDKGFGGDDELQVRLAPDQVMRAYLKFKVEDADLTIGQRDSVRLHLFASNGSDDAGSLYAVPAVYPTTTPNTTPTPWTEGNLTWNRAPPLGGTPLASAGAVADSAWVAFDVATAVPGDGVYAFGLANASANRVDLNSSEADAAVPMLVMNMRIAAAPTPTNVVWPTGVPTPTPTETPTEAPTATITPFPTFTPSPTFEPGMGDRFSPVHDTRVLNTSPDKSYGTSTQLRARSGITTTVAYTYLKFEVAGIMEPDRVLSATLRLYAYDGGVDLSVYRVSNDVKDGSVAWFESDLTWNNAPPMTGEPLDTAAPVASDAYAELDVTGAIAGDGEVSFALRTSAENNIALYSKEAPDRQPELVLRYIRPPAISPTPSNTPTASSTPTPTVFTPTPSPEPPPVGRAYLPYTHRPRR